MKRPIYVLLIIFTLLLFAFAFDTLLKKQKENIITEEKNVMENTSLINKISDDPNSRKETDQNGIINNNHASDNKEKVSIEILDSSFVPKDITINKGTTLIWVNRDYKSHKIAAKTILLNGTTHQEFYSSSIGANSSYNHTFNKGGIYPYYDVVFLKYMKGTITVLD